MQVLPGVIIFGLLFAGFAGFVITCCARVFRAKSEAEDICPHCGYDVRANEDRCPECGKPIERKSNEWFPLRDEWPAAPIAPREPAKEEVPVVIYTTENSMEADLVCQQMEVRGIACIRRKRQYRGGSARGGHIYTEYDAEVWSADADEAKAVLQRLMIRRRRRPDDPVTEPEEG